MIQYNKIRPLLPLLFWLWLISIIVLMVIPTQGGSLYDFSGRDKLIHFILFGLLGFLFVASQPITANLFRMARENIGTYLLFLFSISTEFIQLFLPYRSFELLDILTNLIGIIIGIVGGRLLMKRFLKS